MYVVVVGCITHESNAPFNLTVYKIRLSVVIVNSCSEISIVSTGSIRIKSFVVAGETVRFTRLYFSHLTGRTSQDAVNFFRSNDGTIAPRSGNWKNLQLLFRVKNFTGRVYATKTAIITQYPIGRGKKSVHDCCGENGAAVPFQVSEIMSAYILRSLTFWFWACTIAYYSTFSWLRCWL